MAAAWENSVARPYWYRGCCIRQSVAINAVGSDLATIASWHVPLFVPIVFVPDTAALQWRLTVSVPDWHKVAQITVYRFIGEIAPPLSSKLHDILARLT
ncbi:hypothetical protein [Microseira wollei]|uniref:Uncharacterized protein n=1 Tax=Microseira wollei NIES-4236 TaxID=2530354 RepID=A0AAV3XS91_9CYAN|nr:hypothetical protein [Microseira wollei]GET44220.1 hypothetical protein MiSe_90460 [Microseira wollei NIES-4236]